MPPAFCAGHEPSLPCVSAHESHIHTPRPRHLPGPLRSELPAAFYRTVPLNVPLALQSHFPARLATFHPKCHSSVMVSCPQRWHRGPWYSASRGSCLPGCAKTALLSSTLPDSQDHPGPAAPRPSTGALLRLQSSLETLGQSVECASLSRLFLQLCCSKTGSQIPSIKISQLSDGNAGF